ncbi:MAG: GNAT family N-acetyltransferase, partial [Pseudomonadota bacterium]
MWVKTADISGLMAAEPRPAHAAEAQALGRIAEAAYAPYIPRLGQEPYAMRPDFAGHIRAGNVWVIGDPAEAYLIAYAEAGAWSIDNIAVAPASQGTGLGRALLTFAEREARARGFTSMRLYTNVAMTENQALYAALGWRETGRSQVGAMHRVHFEKPIPGRPMALKAAIFDVFGTVVDWRSGIAAVAGRTFQEKGIAADPLAFADAWRAEYQPSMERVRSGQRGYVSLDDLHYENLDRVLEAFALSDQFSEAERWALNAAWETLPPWPDVGEGLAEIRELMITAPCSNGSIALMTRLAR